MFCLVRLVIFHGGIGFYWLQLGRSNLCLWNNYIKASILDDVFGHEPLEVGFDFVIIEEFAKHLSLPILLLKHILVVVIKCLEIFYWDSWLKIFEYLISLLQCFKYLDVGLCRFYAMNCVLEECLSSVYLVNFLHHEFLVFQCYEGSLLIACLSQFTTLPILLINLWLDLLSVLLDFVDSWLQLCKVKLILGYSVDGCVSVFYGATNLLLPSDICWGKRILFVTSYAGISHF